MTDYGDKQPEFEELIKKSRTKSKSWFFTVLVLWPSVFVALISAAPQWYDKIQGMRLGVRSAADAERQAALWAKNASCVGQQSKGYLSPRNVAVSATICDSGDILIRAVTSNGTQIYKWVPLDDVVRANSPGEVIPTAQK